MSAPETREAERLYTIAEAAVLANVGQDTIRQAIHRTVPPFLRAKKIGRGYKIRASAFTAWIDAHEDA